MAKSKLMDNYGWVQNTSNLSTVRDTLDLVPEHGITHLELREKIREYRELRGDLPKLWSWDARCRIKAIHALGLVKLNRNIQGYELTELGRKLKTCPKSTLFFRRLRLLAPEEIGVFQEGLLTNPPVLRILDLLNEDRSAGKAGLSKYDLGEKLGFIGDVGFTHIDPYWVVKMGYSFNDREGDSDKWARTILSWLIQVGWAKKSGHKDVSGTPLLIFSATDEVERVLRYAAVRIPKNVPSEMLCSEHHRFPKLVQKRRMIILEALKNEPLTIKQLVSKLKENDLEATEDICEFELLNLNNAGLEIVESGGYYKLKYSVLLDYTPIKAVEHNSLDGVEKLIETNVARYQKTLPYKLVDQLIRFGYSKDSYTEFEMAVAEFFGFLGYRYEYLGQGKGRVTDILVKFIHSKHYALSYGLIVDAKATSGSYGFPVGDKRKMAEYIKTHGPALLTEGMPRHAFSFVSSNFVQGAKAHLEEINEETKIKGSAVEVMCLLELGDKIVTKTLKIEDLFEVFTCNDVTRIPSVLE